ncbi:methyl-accepting chemotaxis protein [Pseudooceanicola sp. C21-150M6]|uniref:methyl-accepting chemotaxis protein n=1 Tax=Pseudooceanicola sp. C21-150M6 TaxID=3434355 RepID=UPI003D7F2887
MRRIVAATWVLVPISPIAAWLAGNSPWAVAAFGALIAAIGHIGSVSGGGSGRILAALGLIGQAMAFTAALSGHPWQIDSHMAFFALLAITMALSDARVILVSATVIALHHAFLSLLLPGLIYPSSDLLQNLERTALHGIIVVLEAAVLYLAIGQRVAMDRQMTEAHLAARAAEARDLERQRLMTEQQQRVVQRLSAAMERLAARDLTTRIEEEFGAENEQLRANFNAAVEELRRTVEIVMTNADLVTHDSGAISAAASDLAHRTEKQAASLAEVVSGIHEISSAVRSSAENARRASAVVDEARAEALKSADVVHRATQAMSSIEASSAAISSITEVIDEIAFQTNLLALNAGVEAARAGENGRGFSVVATEVRALAARSSKSAKEIKDLIQTSRDQVGLGVDLVKETGTALGRISDTVSNMASHVSEITTSAEQQAGSITGIESTMQDLDQVTQQNAAMFEETSAASVALSQEAQTLNASVSGFMIGSAPPPRPQTDQPQKRVVNGPPPTGDGWSEF